MSVILSISNIVTAYDERTLGSKVINHISFNEHLKAAIVQHDCAKDKRPGQHFIVLPQTVHQYVSSGVGLASNNPDHYVLRFHREKVSAYLKREFASTIDSLACVVYTLDAYLKDPDATPEEAARISTESPTHVLVAVLASAGPISPLTPFRLVHNLAGGNSEALKYTADEIRTKAKESLTYHNEWSTVAD